MKNIYNLISIFFLSLTSLNAQENSLETDSLKKNSWDFAIQSNFYFFKNDFIILPVIQANYNKLHLESRYNYEDLNTVSFFGGYNFGIEKKILFDATPMLGLALGNTNGLIVALEATLGYKKMELYTETEYLFAPSEQENNFLYTWTDLSYSINDLIFVGISGQRTRLYKTELEVQRGLMAGLSKGMFCLTSYVYNLGFDETFLLVNLSFTF